MGSDKVVESMDTNNNDTIAVRLARYLDHVKRLKKENVQQLLEEAENRSVQQQQVHTNDLDELREYYETQLRLSREKMEESLKAKLKSYEMASQRDKEAIEHARKTLSVVHHQINESETRVIALEQTKLTLDETLNDLKTGLELEQTNFNTLHAVSVRLQEELKLLIDQHEEEAKAEAVNSLSNEIATFNNLLSMEEKRLKLACVTNNNKQIEK